MLIYLDTDLTIYCAKYVDFVFWEGNVPPIKEPKLLREIKALQQIVELELKQLGEGRHVAAPKHLMKELCCKSIPTDERRVYSTLLQVWEEVKPQEANVVDEETIKQIEKSLQPLKLKDKDRRHLAEAIALGAVWFLTNDKRLINHTRPKNNKKVICKVQGVYVAKPSECISEISRGLFLNTVDYNFS